MTLRSGLHFAILTLTLSVSVSLMGCKKTSSSSSGSEELIAIALPPFDLNADGTIKDQGLRRIEEEAGSDKPFSVGFSHAMLTDAGLAQLGKLRNLGGVEAPSSRITPAGIEKLKKAVPGVEVIK